MDLSKPERGFEEQASSADDKVVAQKMLEKASRPSKHQGSVLKTNPWKSDFFGYVRPSVHEDTRSIAKIC